MFIGWLRFLVGFVLVFTALAAYGCVSGFAELTIVVSLLAGWPAVTHTYIEFDERINRSFFCTFKCSGNPFP